MGKDLASLSKHMLAVIHKAVRRFWNKTLSSALKTAEAYWFSGDTLDVSHLFSLLFWFFVTALFSSKVTNFYSATTIW